MRYGTRTVVGRGWTTVGVRPIGTMHIGYDYHYLYVALSPVSGDVFALIMPEMDSNCYEVFLKEFSRYVEQRGLVTEETPYVRFIADNAGSHHATEVTIPAGILVENLPPYSPELNPCERFFEELRRVLKSRVCVSVKEVENIILTALKHYWDNPDAVVKLTYWEWMKNATS